MASGLVPKTTATFTGSAVSRVKLVQDDEPLLSEQKGSLWRQMGIEPTNQNSRCGSIGFEDQTCHQMGGASQAGGSYHPINTFANHFFAADPNLLQGYLCGWESPSLHGSWRCGYKGALAPAVHRVRGERKSVCSNNDVERAACRNWETESAACFT